MYRLFQKCEVARVGSGSASKVKTAGFYKYQLLADLSTPPQLLQTSWRCWGHEGDISSNATVRHPYIFMCLCRLYNGSQKWQLLYQPLNINPVIWFAFIAEAICVWNALTATYVHSSCVTVWIFLDIESWMFFSHLSYNSCGRKKRYYIK